MRLRLFVAASALSAACASSPEGTITVVTGEETDVFSRAPAPVTLVTETIGLDGKRAEIARTALPASTIQLGDHKRSDAGGIAVSGLDASGARVVAGETLFVQWGALEGYDLQVFVQRTGELARLPRGPQAFDATSATILADRYVLGVNGTSTLLYDLLSLETLSAMVLPRPARSIVTVNTTSLVIDEAGGTLFDFSDGTTSTFEPPAGGTFADVAGGALVSAPDGTQYIVGATRAAGGATVRILVIDTEGKTSFAALASPREGACATFVEGRGLVVYGGNDTAPGPEVLAAGAPVASPLPFPIDATRGCALATLDSAHVAVVGGNASSPVRVLDLSCGTGCQTMPWPDPVPVVRAEAFALAPDSVLVLGDDTTGASHAYRASTQGLREIPLKVPRRGAHLVKTPTNAFAVVGGGVGIEQYRE